MKKIFLFIIFLLSILISTAQDYLKSKTCHYNAYDPTTSGSTRKECVEATFKFNAPGFGGCTGTLINRNTDDSNVRFFFLTARHCFYGGGSPNWDWEGVDVNFYFNYQSKDGSNGSVPTSNQGWISRQSNLYDDPPGIPSFGLFNDDNYQYYHRSQIRVVTMQFWGDLALCEIITPVPPHFNITYAGWNPSKFNGWNSLGSFAGIHHPAGDIKKISQTPSILWLETPVATGCYTITKTIDFLMGWVWHRRFSTSVICKVMDNPKFLVPTWFKGGTEGGSSGSGMFSTQNKHFGVLSFGFSACSDVVNQDFYGKLHSNYGNASVKGTLNPIGGPNNRLFIDFFGMPSRKITCYPNLVLPGAAGVSGEYFPAQDYQAENKITLQAVTNITTNAPINIYANADYRFRAGNTIVLDNGFDARPGSTFVAEIGGCIPQGQGGLQKTTDPNAEILTALSQIHIPKKLDFDAAKYVEGSLLQSDGLMAHIFPNPSKGDFTIRFTLAGDYKVKMTNLLGITIYASELKNTSEIKMQLSSLNLSSGNYFINISNGAAQFAGKVMITE